MKRIALLAACTIALAAPAFAQTAPKLASLNHQGLDPASGKAPKQLVVFFHGYTQKGEAMKVIADALAARLPDAAFVYDNAPLTQGNGFAWYPLGGDPAVATAAKASAKAGAIALVKSLSETYKIAPSNIVVVGFSQGGGIAFDAGACSTPDVKAIVSLAGVLESTCYKEAKGTPASVLIIHNDEDPTVKQDRIDAFQAALKTAGYDSKLETVAGKTHFPAADGIQKAEDFIVAQLGGK